MRLPHIALCFALVLVVAACSSAGSTTSASVPEASSSAAGSGAAQRIEVKLTDALKMEPAEMTVKVGQPVTFVVTNAGATDHEFFLGDETAQNEHGTEMKSMGGMMAHDEANGIGLKPGETKELTHTFAAVGPFQAGCHVNAHYDTGMKMTITVQ